MRGGLVLVVAALATPATSCTLITDFDTSSLAEDSEVLCSDEVDNDGNGLADCADFGCLDKPSCCVIPRVAIDDDFAPACADVSCADPDPACLPDDAVWQRWGAPQPVLCDGRLSPHKLEQCYDVGVLSRNAVTVEPGLVVAAVLVGVPEPRGRLEVGISLQDAIPGSDDPCESITTSDPVLSIRQLADEGGGYRLVARFDAADAGVSDRFTDGAPRQIELAIADDRRVHYLIDGVEFATSPAEQPIPEVGPVGRVVMAGRGLAAGVDRVTVTVGTDCDTPGLWRPAEPFMVLEAGLSGRWDDYSVFAPALAPVDDAGGVDLFYGGCREKGGACDPLVAGLGVAGAVAPFEFASEADCPLVGASSIVCADGIESPFADQFDNLIDAAPFRLGDQLLALASQQNGGDQIVTLRIGDGVTALGGLDDRIRTGNSGAWDSFQVCCASVVVDDDGRVRAWYAGRNGASAPWRVGLAESIDGVLFAKHPNNPILREGPAGDFDEDGAAAPSVLHARGVYRMWYEARGFFGATSIGYAVSTDGVRWHKYPGNPVLLPDAIGLAAIRAPSVALVGGRLEMVVGVDADAGSAIHGLLNGAPDDEAAAAARGMLAP